MTFELFPAIDLRGGKVVRLRQGDYAHETEYSNDPVAVATGFRDGGAQWIHIVDLDSARDGGAANLPVIAKVATAVPQCKIQTGGGVRSLDDARARLDAGATRVVIGSAAVDRPELVGELAAVDSSAVVVGLDVRGREVSTHGWTRGAGVDVFELVRRFASEGAAAFVVTQIDVDGMLTGSDVALYRELLAITDVDVVASGGVGTTDDLRALAALRVEDRSLAGVIAGKAIYEGRFSVSEGIVACLPAG